MYQLDVIAVAHIQDMRREAEQSRLVAKAKAANTNPKHIAADTLIWAGQRLTNWGTQLQRKDRRPAFN